MASTGTLKPPPGFSSTAKLSEGAPSGGHGRAAWSPCAECLTVPAACRCVKCECLLCLSCFEEVHRASKYMRKHEYELLGPKDLSRKCDRHVDRAVEYYCAQDRTPVCSHCVVMGEHKSHDVYLLEEAAQRLMDDATRLSEEASTLLQSYNDLLDSTSSLILSSHSHENRLVNELKEHFENISALLRSRHEKLERDVHIASENRLRTLKELHSKTAARKTEIETIVAEVGGLERSQVVFHADLLQQLKDALQDEEIVAADSLDLVQINLDSSKLHDLLTMHGDIVTERQNLPNSENLPCQVMENSNQTILASKVENIQSDLPIVVPFTNRNQCSLSPPPVKRVIDFPSAPVSYDMPATSFPLEHSSLDLKSFSAVHIVNSDLHLWPKPSDNSKSGSCFQLSSVTRSSSESSSSGSSCHTSAKASVSDFNGTTAENHVSSRSSSTGCTKSVPPGFKKLPRANDVSQSWRNGVVSSNGFGSLDSSGQSLSFSGRMESVMVSHVSHPGLFWVHLSKDLEKLGRLSQDIQDYCNGNCKPCEKLMTKGFKEGDLVFAKFRDDVWYRAEVTGRSDIGDGCVFLGVRSIDYGRDDIVALGRVEAVRPNFLKIPQLACLCCLADVKPTGGDEWSAEATKMFQHLVSNVPMMMRISTQFSNMYHIRLSWPLKEGVSDDQLVYVSDALVFQELATYANPEAILPNREKCLPSRYIKPIIPEGGRVIPVVVTEVFSPHLFYVQVQQKEFSYFIEMMAEIQDACEDDASSTLRLFLPFVGTSCLVKFRKQGQWCRSEVTELLGGGRVKVFNVDFGGTEIVNVIEMKKLPDRFVVLPTQAIRCTLADVDLIGGSSDESASSVLSSIATQAVFMNIKEASSGPVLSVYLSKDPEFSSESLLNFLLISSGLAVASVKRAGPLDSTHDCLMSSSSTSLHDELNMKVSGQKESRISKLPPDLASSKVEDVRPRFVTELPNLPKLRRASTPSASNSQQVRISHFVTPDEFYIQVAATKNLNRLTGLMQELNAEYQHSHPDASRVWEIGNECVAQYSADGCWYRAKIIGADEDRVEVLCRDYGYRDFLHRSNLQGVDARFMRDPWYSICCHLVDLVPSDKSRKWSSDTCEILQAMLTDKVCHVDIKDFTAEGSLPVDILFLETVKGTALKPDYSVYVSLTDWLIESGHAMPPGSMVEHFDAGCSDEDISNNICDRINGLEEKQAVLESEGLDVSSSLDIGKSYLSDWTPSRADYQPPEYPNSETFSLVVTSVDDEFCIYGQQAKAKADLTSLGTLMDRVHARYHCTMPEASSHVWTLGQPVASQFTEDNMFYRARIVGFRESGIEVQYVDYGNREVVRKERLRMMDQTFLSIPIQCLSCCLYNVHPTSPSGKWSPDTICYFNALLYNKACKVSVRARDAVRSRPLVDLQLPDGRDLASMVKEDRFANDEDLAENSVASGGNSRVRSFSRRLADRIVPSPYHQMTLPAVGDLLHVIVTEIERPNVLYIQHVLMENTDSETSRVINNDLKRLAALSVEYSNSVATFERLNETAIHSGTACVAQYSSDKCWYRAEIIEVKGETEVGVRFVDYGSSDFLSAENLRAIPADHLALPAQCWRCRLNGLDVLSNDEAHVADVVQKLTRLFANQALVAIVKNILSHGVLDVDLYGRKHYLETGILGPLFYQGLIDEGLFGLADYDSDEGVVVECQEEVIIAEGLTAAVSAMTIA